MTSISAPYFYNNKEWYYYDEKDEIYKLTDKAPKEAIDSYMDFYREEFSDFIYVKVSYYDYLLDQYEPEYKSYYYKTTDRDIFETDVVLVERNGQKVKGIVNSVEYYYKDEVPYPVEKIKDIIKILDDEDE